MIGQQAGAPATRRQTVEQTRAAYALTCIRAVQPSGQGASYLPTVRGLPAMVLTNGLGQTLAFLKAKNKRDLYRHLDRWVGKQLGLPGDLLEAVTQMDVATYRLAQVEALALLGWLKRFAEAELEAQEEVR